MDEEALSKATDVKEYSKERIDTSFRQGIVNSSGEYRTLSDYRAIWKQKMHLHAKGTPKVVKCTKSETVVTLFVNLNALEWQ